MFKVVIDANLFVSAILTPTGKPAKILDLVLDKKIKLAISFSILGEIREVLLYPHLKKLHGLGEKEIEQKLNRIIKFASFTPGDIKLTVIKADPSDNKYLECAVEGEVDYLISGDRHLKDLGSYSGIKIISPANFLELVS